MNNTIAWHKNWNLGLNNFSVDLWLIFYFADNLLYVEFNEYALQNVKKFNKHTRNLNEKVCYSLLPIKTIYNITSFLNVSLLQKDQVHRNIFHGTIFNKFLYNTHPSF
jgi:hypothetical protein